MSTVPAVTGVALAATVFAVTIRPIGVAVQSGRWASVGRQTGSVGVVGGSPGSPGSRKLAATSSPRWASGLTVTR